MTTPPDRDAFEKRFATGHPETDAKNFRRDSLDGYAENRIDALWEGWRAALAAPLPEPVARVWVDGDIWDWYKNDPSTDLPDGEHLLYTAPIAAATENTERGANRDVSAGQSHDRGSCIEQSTRAANGGSVDAGAPVFAASPLPQPPDDTDLPRLIFEAIGHASMCWKGGPSGVFDSDEATKCAEQLIKDVRALYRGTESDLTARPAKNAAAQEHDRMPSALGSTGVGQTDDGALASGQGMRARNAEGSPPVAAAPIEARPVPTPSVEQDAKRWNVCLACVRQGPHGEWVIHEDDPHNADGTKFMFTKAIDAMLGAAPQAPEPGEA